MNEELLIVDVQNHFLKYSSKVERNNLIENIQKYIKENNVKSLNIVCDQHNIEEFGQENVENFIYEMENYIEDFDEMGKIYDNYYDLIENNIDTGLINIIYELDLDYTIYTKEYGQIRDLMDNSDEEILATMIYLINKDKSKNMYSDKYEIEDLENEQLKPFFKKIDDLIGGISDKESFIDEINNYKKKSGTLDIEYVYDEYQDLLSNIKNKQITIMGGGAGECLLEEIMKIQAYLIINGIDVDVNYSSELMYGDYYEFKSKYENFIETLEDLKTKLDKNEISLIKSINEKEFDSSNTYFNLENEMLNLKEKIEQQTNKKDNKKDNIKDNGNFKG